jgi:hypothetical protein
MNKVDIQISGLYFEIVLKIRILLLSFAMIRYEKWVEQVVLSTKVDIHLKNNEYILNRYGLDMIKFIFFNLLESDISIYLKHRLYSQSKIILSPKL